MQNNANIAITLLGYCLHNNRKDIVNLLNQNGYPVSASATDSDLQTLVITAVAENSNFQSGLAALMDQKAKAIYGATGYNNATGGMPNTKVWKNAIDDWDLNYSNEMEDMSGGDTGTTSNTSGGGKTALGSALQGLITTDTLKNVLNSGLSIWASSINNNAQQQSYQSAIQLEQVKLQAAQAQAAAAAAGQYGAGVKTGMPTWGWILIGVGVVATTITIVVVASNKK